jgi:alpha-glucosidase
VYHDTPVDVGVGTRRARAAVTLLAALPGSCYLYQGEELGLPEVLDLPPSARTDPIFLRTDGRELGRDGCRVPLPWTQRRDTSFGFSADPSTPWLPQPDVWAALSVAVEQVDDSSMLVLYRRVFAARRTIDIVDESLTWLLPDMPDLVAFGRAGIVVVLNPTASQIDIGDALGVAHTLVVSSTAGHTDVTAIPADTCLWLRPA